MGADGAAPPGLRSWEEWTISSKHRKADGRLSHVTKPGVGIRESQIVQTAIDKVVIRVVPDGDFDPKSMSAVLAAAHRYMGESMRISWEKVDRLPRMRSGKLRHVIWEIP